MNSKKIFIFIHFLNKLKGKKWMKKQTKCGSPDKTLVGMEESAGAVIQSCSVKKVSLKKLYKIHRKIPMLESLYNEVSGLETSIFVKKWLQQRCFPVKFLRTPILWSICKQLLLNQLGIRCILFFWSPFRVGGV